LKLDDAFDGLKHALESRRLAQGYLVEVSSLRDGRELAEKFLCLLFCEAGRKPCGSCDMCRQVAEHRHPDLHWIEPESKSRRITIDRVRELRGRMYRTAYAGGWKACVLAGADRLGEEASNAFLKTLEEPAGDCVFLLLTDSPQTMLPTVLSRCQRITVTGGKTVPGAEWQQALVDILASGSGGGEVASLALGERLVRLLKGVRKAVEEQEAEAANEEALEDTDKTLDARINARYIEIRAGIMRGLLAWHRDILLLRCGASEDVVHYRGHVGTLSERAAELTYGQTLGNVRTVEEMERQLERSLPEGYVISFGFGRLL